MSLMEFRVCNILKISKGLLTWHKQQRRGVLSGVAVWQGMIALILETIDHCSQWKSMRHLAHLIGEESAARWNDMISYLYLLLGNLVLLTAYFLSV